MVEITLPIVLQILQTAGILVGIFYYIMTLRNAEKARDLTLKSQEHATETRQAQLFMQLYDKYSDPEFVKHQHAISKWEWTDYEDFLERYGNAKNPDVYIHFSQQARFFEGVGVLVKRKFIDPAVVDDLMSGNVLDFWEKFGESFIKELQERNNYPQFYEHVEYLYHVIKPIRDSQHPELKT
jgi:hypothetical protein